MPFPISVQADNGHFTASLVGAKDICVVAPSREQAISEIQSEIERRLESGDLVALDIPKSPLLALAGKYAGDTSLADISADAYRQRDAERPE